MGDLIGEMFAVFIEWLVYKLPRGCLIAAGIMLLLVVLLVGLWLAQKV